MSRWHAAANVTMLAFVGLVAFAVSFVAIRAFALREGWSPPLASAAPLLVDTLTVLGASIVLARARDGERALYGWALVAAASIVSLAVNVAHAHPNASARLLAALPPVALLASAEAVLSEARRAQRAQRRLAAPAARPPSEQAPRRAPVTAPELGKRATRPPRQRAHAAHVFRGLAPVEQAAITQRAFAELAGISKAYAAEVLPELRAAQLDGAQPGAEQAGAA